MLTAQKKVKDSEWVSTNANDLKARADKGDLDAASIARIESAHPELAKKYFETNDAKAKENVNNLMASSLIKLTHSTDANNDAASIRAALKQYGVPLNLSDDATPDELKDALKVAIYGVKAIDQKTKSVDEFGNVVEKNALGEQVGYDRAPVKPTKATPVMVNGSPKTVKVPGTNEVKILMSDGTLSSGGAIPKPEPLEDAANSFTPAAIDNAAARYNIDGTLPPMGMGKGGSAARSQILNRAAELASGTNGTDQRVNQLTTKASASTLLQLKKTKTMIKAFEEMANKNADIALEMSEKVDRTGSPVVNRWIQAGRSKLLGDDDVSTFNTAVNVFANEYAKIMSGSMGNTPVSDSARKEAHEILNTAQTPAQLRANIKLLQREMKNRIIGLDESEHELIQQMKSASTSTKKEDEGKKPTGNQGKQPQTPYEWYVLHWNDAQKKGDKVRMQRLTEEAKKMGIAK